MFIEMKFLKANPLNFSALILILIAFVFNCVEAFDNTLYTKWLRQNIHLFTPIIPALLLTIGIMRKENFILFAINLLLIGSHYYFIKILNDIGRAGAGVLKLL